mmetsp:Transcript_7682/g.7227  ORF Transcript_7682/g.7227 Transcript_7682/m.7227 type:complete len:142 (-) Transcript_7682:2030-2455(-)
MIRGKINSYDDNYPLLELWRFLVSKYENISNNNSLYIVFFDNIKTKIESLVATYTNNSKGSYKDVQTIYEELNCLQDSADSEEQQMTSEYEIAIETENLINAIGLVSMSVQETFTHIEVFIKSLYSCLSALVAYEGTYIQQ